MPVRACACMARCEGQGGQPTCGGHACGALAARHTTRPHPSRPHTHLGSARAVVRACPLLVCTWLTPACSHHTCRWHLGGCEGGGGGRGQRRAAGADKAAGGMKGSAQHGAGRVPQPIPALTAVSQRSGDALPHVPDCACLAAVLRDHAVCTSTGAGSQGVSTLCTPSRSRLLALHPLLARASLHSALPRPPPPPPPAHPAPAPPPSPPLERPPTWRCHARGQTQTSLPPGRRAPGRAGGGRWERGCVSRV